MPLVAETVRLGMLCQNILSVVDDISKKLGRTVLYVFFGFIPEYF